MLQFNNVGIDSSCHLSFSIDAGETLVLKLASKESKALTCDMALGEKIPVEGEILLQGKALQMAKPGSIGWIPAGGGLISNLKTWENVTLPLWYHNRRDPASTEQTVSRWLVELGVAESEWERYMASPAANLRLVEKKRAGILRALVHSPSLMIIDASLFEEVEASRAQTWIAALEKFAHETDNRAVLVITHAATILPWKIIK